MAARLCPDNVRQAHQSLHHVVTHAPWSDEDLLEAVRQYTGSRRNGEVDAAGLLGGGVWSLESDAKR